MKCRAHIRTLMTGVLFMLVPTAQSEERAIDALIADLEGRIAHCESVGAEDCVRQCRGAVDGINHRIVSRGLDYDDRTRPSVDRFYVNPCLTVFNAAEATPTAPSIPDVEGTFRPGGSRGSFAVSAEGRDADWMEICGGATRIKEPGGLARRPEGIRIRLVNITYDPERVGQLLTPCTAERVEFLD